MFQNRHMETTIQGEVHMVLTVPSQDGKRDAIKCRHPHMVPQTVLEGLLMQPCRSYSAAQAGSEVQILPQFPDCWPMGVCSHSWCTHIHRTSSTTHFASYRPNATRGTLHTLNVHITQPTRTSHTHPQDALPFLFPKTESHHELQGHLPLWKAW